jgi:hypothetical protein
MRTQAIHKLLDLARRLPSIEILNAAEVTPLLEAARAIKAAEGELKEACAYGLEEEELVYRIDDLGSISERENAPVRQTLSLSF